MWLQKKKGIEIEEDDDVEEQGEEAVGHGQEVSSLDEESDDDIDEVIICNLVPHITY